jgi:transposase InsO family protein
MRLFKNIKNIEIYRYGIISPVLHGSQQCQNQYFHQLSEKGIKIPPDHGDIFHLDPSTFKRWLRLYRKHGLEGLKEKIRSDKGTYRKLPAHLLDTIIAFIQEVGAESVSDLYRKLLMEKHITLETLSYESLRQLVLKHQLLSPEKNIKPRKKFEKEFINELWMIDFKQGKSIRQGNRLHRVYLCAIIDDASRLLVGYEWGLNEDTTLFARTFKKAVAIYGTPQILYCDQAKVFRSHYIMELCARLGISLLNAEPYSPESKGKIERFNRTIQQMFYPMVNDFQAIDCQQLNQLFDTFVQQIYHKKVHTSLNESPLQKFQRLLNQTPIRRINQDQLEKFFLCSFKRKVRLDGTIVHQNIYYEVDMKYAGDMIDIRFPVDNPQRLFLFDQVGLIKELKPVNLVANANPFHISTSYSTLLQKEKEKEKEKDKS